MQVQEHILKWYEFAISLPAEEVGELIALLSRRTGVHHDDELEETGKDPEGTNEITSWPDVILEVVKHLPRTPVPPTGQDGLLGKSS
jgi:hypothetical protein